MPVLGAMSIRRPRSESYIFIIVPYSAVHVDRGVVQRSVLHHYNHFQENKVLAIDLVFAVRRTVRVDISYLIHLFVDALCPHPSILSEPAPHSGAFGGLGADDFAAQRRTRSGLLKLRIDRAARPKARQLTPAVAAICDCIDAESLPT
jgi:hypothetical protein